MKLTFLGTGSFFAGYDINHTNLLITTDSGKNLLLDCSSRVPLMLDKLKIDPSVIDAVYISHMHDDHIGGIEWLAFYSHFVKQSRPTLICHSTVMDRIWDGRLRCAAASLTNQMATLETYFRPKRVRKTFTFDGVKFEVVPVLHVDNGTCPVLSFGLTIKANGKVIYWTSDMGAAGDPESLRGILLDVDLYVQSQSRYMCSDIIIQDCEVGPYASGVHTHYNDLKRLHAVTKKKMILCHYGSRAAVPKTWRKDGFMGVAKPGQVIEV